jgi:MraZ protein
MIEFTGTFEHAMDEKGRLSVPSQFREVLAGSQDEYLVVTRFRVEEHPCLQVFPASEWRTLLKRLKEQTGRFAERASKFHRAYVSVAARVTMDSHGRILVPPKLRDLAKLDRDVVTTGGTGCFQVWDQGIWNERMSRDEAIFDDREFLDSLDV